jgi:hypothetical protein
VLASICSPEDVQIKMSNDECVIERLPRSLFKGLIMLGARRNALNVQIAVLRPRLVLGEARRFAVDFLLACLNDPRLARFPRGHAPAVGVSTLSRFAPAVIAGCVWV